MALWPALVLEFPGPGHGDRSGAPSLEELASAGLDGLEFVAVAEQADDRWQVCFQTAGQRAEAAARLAAALGPLGLAVRAVEIEDEDWARRSQVSLRAVRVGILMVAPPWDAEAAVANPDAITILIEPAMGFGSGHHATTRLCLDALQRTRVAGRRVLDVGTGSGVLALAAARLGASRVVAIDIDPDAIDNARANAALNGSPDALEFRLGDFRSGTWPDADVVVANLTGGMLAASSAALSRTVARGGLLVLSGITADERDAVLGAFADGFVVDGETEEEGWCCLVLRPDR